MILSVYPAVSYLRYDEYIIPACGNAQVGFEKISGASGAHRINVPFPYQFSMDVTPLSVGSLFRQLKSTTKDEYGQPVDLAATINIPRGIYNEQVGIFARFHKGNGNYHFYSFQVDERYFEVYEIGFLAEEMFLCVLENGEVTRAIIHRTPDMRKYTVYAESEFYPQIALGLAILWNWRTPRFEDGKEVLRVVENSPAFLKAKFDSGFIQRVAAQ